ncbi:hypothetical protein Y032_0513g2756 [Ancylostoma ceylanicum]|uniref:Ubiquitin-like modifier-activating enzyme Atg7 N-terminal domain-containing protein n=1 Tax=Ancylostoma ceylanicum TaxID=53326 RepID=A0A016WTE8_9BILA|nr:hypothetical protein Y032_0513g2756 [Ancylostoma ceylanicum]
MFLVNCMGSFTSNSVSICSQPLILSDYCVSRLFGCSHPENGACQNTIVSKMIVRCQMSQAEFVPFSTFIDTTFWAELNRRKLHEWRLDETPRYMSGSFSLVETVGECCWLSLGHESFQQSDANVCNGQLLLFNTLENFKGLDRKALLRREAQKVWDLIVSGEWLYHPDRLTTFIFTVFADLKKYQYYYWNCFPTLCFPSQIKQEVSFDVNLVSFLLFWRAASIFFKRNSVRSPIAGNKCGRSCGQCQIVGPVCAIRPYLCFIAKVVSINVDGKPLHYYDKERAHVFLLYSDGQCVPLHKIVEVSDPTEMKVVYADPSPVRGRAGWPLRNLVAAVAYSKPSWNSCSFISLREGNHLEEFKISWEQANVNDFPPTVGWERTHEGKMVPQFADMRKQFDPKKLMEQSVGLNLSLIKWRLVPEMRLERYSSLSVKGMTAPSKIYVLIKKIGAPFCTCGELQMAVDKGWEGIVICCTEATDLLGRARRKTDTS